MKLSARFLFGATFVVEAPTTFCVAAAKLRARNCLQVATRTTTHPECVRALVAFAVERCEASKLLAGYVFEVVSALYYGSALLILFHCLTSRGILLVSHSRGLALS